MSVRSSQPIQIGLGFALLFSFAAPRAGIAASSDIEPWTQQNISSEMFESHAAFDPRTGDVYFVRSSKQFSGWRILMSSCHAGGWSAPVDPPFSADGLEADPYFTPDGRSLYFISSRRTKSHKSEALDIWRVDRTDHGEWGAPYRLPEPVNSESAEWFPRPATDGWLYFGSNRPGGHGKTDIWRARENAAGSWTVENLDAGVNTPRDEYEPQPSPDGLRLIIGADDGLYESRRTPHGWSRRERLSSSINVNGTEIGALYSPSGRSLLFARDTGEPRSGEFFVWRLSGHEKWPPTCPAQ